MKCVRCDLIKPYQEFPNGSDTRNKMKRLFGEHFILCKVCWTDHNYIEKRRKNERERELGRECARCHKTKRLEEFYYRTNSKAQPTKSGTRHSYCKQCSSEVSLLNATEDRAKNLAYRYGISIHDFESLATSGCQICGAVRPDRTLVVDHDHDTGRFRGILCAQCNSALGLLGDSPEVLFKAFYYLDSRKREKYGGNNNS